jgi:alpha-tubulin suppressor-like RCC1 family protein
MRKSQKFRVAACVAVSLGAVVTMAAPPVGASPTQHRSATATYEWGDRRTTPGLVHGVIGEIGINAGNYGVMMINANRTVEAWGQSWAPRGVHQLPVVKNVVQLTNGNDDYAALEAPSGISPGTCPKDTSVWTVGLNRGSDLGLGDNKNDTYTTPQRVTTLDGLGVVQVVAASGHMLALTCTGKVYVWGSNGEGTLAMPSNDRAFPKPILNEALSALTHGSSKGVELATGSFSADLLVDGKAYGWGNNRLDQCGCGSTAKIVSTPTPVRQGGVLFTAIHGGGNYVDDGHTVAVDAAGNAYCWGDNQEGQCGVGSTGVLAVPKKVKGLPVVTQGLAGGEYSMFLATDGAVWTCGSNAIGQVGNGSGTNQLTPVRVLNNMTMISAGAGHAVAAN